MDSPSSIDAVDDINGQKGSIADFLEQETGGEIEF